MAQTAKRRLADSLKDLLSKKTLDKITVKEICENCNVNRQTFYYNFHDIFDLMEWILKDDLENIEESGDDYESYRKNIYSIFEYARENKRFVLNAFNSVPRAALEKYFMKRAVPDVEAFVDNRFQTAGISPDDKDFIVNIYAIAMMGLIFQWIEEGMNGDYAKKLNQLKMLMEGSINYVIEKSGRNKREEMGNNFKNEK